MIKKLVASLVLVVVTACASFSPNEQLVNGFNTVSAYVDVTKNAVARGRITPERGTVAVKNAEKARDQLVAARAALALCKPAVPCTDFESLLKSVQPSLIELEIELRKAQKEAP